MSTLLVRFTKSGIGGHRLNEVAGFPEEDARWYVEKGLAELVGKPDPKLTCLHGQVPKELRAKLKPGQSIKCDCGAKVAGSGPLPTDAEVRADLVSVMFLCSSAPYRVGEVVGLPAEIAAEFCAMKQAKVDGKAPEHEFVCRKATEADLKAYAKHFEHANDDEGRGVVLRFLKPYGKYRKGEVAVFSEKRALEILGLEDIEYQAGNDSPLNKRQRKDIAEEVKSDIDLNAAPREEKPREWQIEGEPAEAVNLSDEQNAAIRNAKDKMVRPADVTRK